MLSSAEEGILGGRSHIARIFLFPKALDLRV